MSNSDDTQQMECRAGCGACCIAPSISSAIPGMPQGKPASVRCHQLSDSNRCLLFSLPNRPEVCTNFTANADVCGTNSTEALQLITRLEQLT